MSRGTHYVPFHKYRLWWNFGRKEEEEEEVITRRGPSTERRWPFPLRKNNVLASNFVLIWVIQIHGVVQYYDVHRNSRATSMCSDNVQGKSLSGAHIIHAWSMYTSLVQIHPRCNSPETDSILYYAAYRCGSTQGSRPANTPTDSNTDGVTEKTHQGKRQY